MDERFTDRKYRKRIIKACFFITILIFLLEVSVYFVMKHYNLKSAFFSHYFLVYVFLPTAVNACSVWFMHLINKSSGFSSYRKNVCTVYGLNMMLLNATCVHCYFTAVFCSLPIPFLITCVYGNKRLIKKCMALTVCSLIISMVVSAFTEQKNNPILFLNFIVMFMVLIVIYILGNAIINYSHENEMAIRHQMIKQQSLENKLRCDPMTGLYNHSEFYKRLNEIINDKTPFSLAIIDVDDFKRINDKYGHDCGDKVLIRLAEIIKSYCSQTDIACRYGGEEFAIILPCRTKKEALHVLQSISAAFIYSKFDFTSKIITFSGGICTHNGETALATFKLADAAMYKAKQQGKNKIITE